MLIEDKLVIFEVIAFPAFCSPLSTHDSIRTLKSVSEFSSLGNKCLFSMFCHGSFPTLCLP
jgi:hypothetical protein